MKISKRMGYTLREEDEYNRLYPGASGRDGLKWERVTVIGERCSGGINLYLVRFPDGKVCERAIFFSEPKGL